MKRDEIWEKLKNDKSEIYGEPILDTFLKLTDRLNSNHYKELDDNKKKLVNFNIRFVNVSTVEEAEKLMKEKIPSKFGVSMNILNSLLDNAASDGNLELFKWTYEKGSRNIYGGASSAAEKGKLEIIKFLSEKGISEELVTTILSSSALNGHLEVCKWVFENNRDYERDGYNLQLILERAAEKDHMKICEWVLEKGIVYEFSLALIFAARSGNLKLCESILSKRGNKDLNRALSYAAHNNHLETCELLIKYGAKSLKDTLTDIVKHKGDKKIIKLLLNNVLDSNSKKLEFLNNNDPSPSLLSPSEYLNHLLYYAAVERKDLEICKILIEKGAKTSTILPPDSFHRIIKNTTPEIAKYLESKINPADGSLNHE